ncbi:inositol monophosphatase family protein [Longirhabdus pacifica]|uniref:inositol monophosphatase family protein n=1 Tax=Longirhabdus pacifica TaxID=2305227 RepID=UPI001008B8FB|nr:inositol monophosphatase family protein [Longirhabdus pacifica]
MDILHHAEMIAVEAANAAGQYIKSRFNHKNHVSEKDDYGDVVTEVDLKAEEMIINRIRKVFPNHQIYSEEMGCIGEEGDWEWHIDPLDGTNNFVIGMPLFSVSIGLMYKKQCVFAVIYEPMTEQVYTSSIGKGTRCNGEVITMQNKVKEIYKSTVGWIQGHGVQNEHDAVKFKHYLDVKYKRMIRLWAPTLQWCMLAKGDIEAIYVYRSEGEDLYSGMLMAKEAGAVIMDFQGNVYEGGMITTPYLIACHEDYKDHFLSEVKNAGLSMR